MGHQQQTKAKNCLLLVVLVAATKSGYSGWKSQQLQKIAILGIFLLQFLGQLALSSQDPPLFAGGGHIQALFPPAVNTTKLQNNGNCWLMTCPAKEAMLPAPY